MTGYCDTAIWRHELSLDFNQKHVWRHKNSTSICNISKTVCSITVHFCVSLCQIYLHSSLYNCFRIFTGLLPFEYVQNRNLKLTIVSVFCKPTKKQFSLLLLILVIFLIMYKNNHSYSAFHYICIFSGIPKLSILLFLILTKNMFKNAANYYRSNYTHHVDCFPVNGSESRSENTVCLFKPQSENSFSTNKMCSVSLVFKHRNMSFHLWQRR